MSLWQVHVTATLCLVGLIWVVQLVIYPLFASIESLRAYHADYTRRITWVVAPLMGGELVTGILLVLEPPQGIAPELLWAGLGLIGVNWLCTALVSAPLHGRLTLDFERSHASLVATNWIRTLSWTARGVLVVTALPV